METKTILNILIKELGIKGLDKGKSFFFLCPFHNDKNPSLSFEKINKFFNCFSCDFKAKNIFVFWSKLKRISMDETLEQLSSLGYIQIEKRSRIEFKDEKEKSIEIFDLISKIYQNNLLTNEGKASLEYLKEERGLTTELIDNFELGTSIDGNQLTSLLLDSKNEYKKNEIIGTNLFKIIKGINNEWFCDYFWKDQIIFPIKDDKGRISIFASRKLEKDGDNKYIFSPNNNIIQKSSVIYNYDFVKRETIDHCYLVEGFFDVISLTKVGIKNCISLLGVSISKEQINLLRRLEKKIIIFLDGDEAGLEASVKIATIMALNNIDCEVIMMESENKVDPDDICRSNSEDIFRIVNKRASPFLFVINYYYKLFNVEENHQSIGSFIKKVASEFKQFRNSTQAFIIKNISNLMKMSVEEVEELYLSDNWYKKEIKTLDRENKDLDESEKAIIYYCCKSRSIWENLEDRGVVLLTNVNSLIYKKVKKFYLQNPSATNFKELGNNEVFSNIVFLSFENREKFIINKILERFEHSKQN
jgi:DNA primase